MNACAGVVLVVPIVLAVESHRSNSCQTGTYVKYHVDIKRIGKSALKCIPLPTLIPAEGNIYSSVWDKLPY